MSTLQYRPEIDGLRAVAVLAVILFHAGVPFFGGGYVGVDVFFVISGFLITSLIVRELNAGTFSFFDFWERRARRILPAQLLVMAATMAACAFLYFPDDLQFAMKQALSQLAFASNIFFYEETDYFSADQIAKPFQHFWSLAVEEQFYFVIPPLLWALWRYRKNAFHVLGILAVFSFAACLWRMSDDASAAFYLLPYRAWELLLGGLVATQPFTLITKRRDCEIVSLAGLGLILFSVFYYTSQTPFPGIAAFVPCIGTVMILLAAKPETLVGRGLSLKPMVMIGLISYALYLWHWPFLIIAEYMQPAGLSWPQKASIIALVFVFSALSWKFVETPLRKRAGRGSAKKFALGMASIAILLGCAGFYSLHQHKLEMEKVELALQIHKDGIFVEEYPDLKICNLTNNNLTEKTICQTNKKSGLKPDFVVWGDSYAKASAPAFFELSRELGQNGYFLAKSNCPPIFYPVIRGAKDPKACKEFNDRVFQFIQKHDIKTVFMVGSWTNWYKDENVSFENKDWITDEYKIYKNDVVAATRYTIQRYLDAGIVPYFVINQPKMTFETPHLLEMERRMGVRETKAYISLKKYLNERKNGLDDLVESLKGTPVVVVDPLKTFCSGDICIASRDGKPLYKDRGHLSVEGARFEKPLFEKYFREGFQKDGDKVAPPAEKSSP